MSPILPNMSVRTALHRSILTPSPKGLGRQGCRHGRPTGVFRPLRRCRAPHADGAVAGEIDTIEHSTRVINVVYIAFYAFTAHDRRRVFVARAATAGGSWAPIETHDDKASSCAASPLPVRAPAVA